MYPLGVVLLVALGSFIAGGVVTCVVGAFFAAREADGRAERTVARMQRTDGKLTVFDRRGETIETRAWRRMYEQKVFLEN